MILTTEDLCKKMGENMEEISLKKAKAMNIRELLDIISRDNLDIMHYIVEPNDIPNYNYKMTDIFALKEYLLYISMFDKNLEYREDFNKNLEEELWINLTQRQLEFIEICLVILNQYKDIAKKIIKDIHRGLRTYPFPEVKNN